MLIVDHEPTLIPTYAEKINSLVWDFIIADRLLPYQLQNPYGHLTYLLIFAIC